MKIASLWRSLMAASLLLCIPLCSAHDYTLGKIRIGHPWARATPPGAQTGGGYLTLENNGAADRLVSVSTNAARTAELHSMSMEGNMMKMQKLDKGIELPPGKTVALKPGALHIMLLELQGALKEGQSFPLKLKFEKAGEITVDVKVQGMSADGSKRDSHQSH